MKKKFLKIFYITLLISNILDKNNLNSMNFSSFDDSINLDDISISPDLFDNIDTSKIQTKAYDDMFEKLSPIIVNIETPLWYKTKPPRGRDVLYLMPHRISGLEYGGALCNLFFNFTNKMDFSTDETLMLDANKTALDEFTQTMITELGASDASALIPLFKKLTIQERKIGGLFQLAFIKSAFKFEIDTSLLFSERNFWLTQKDQNRIKQMFAGDDSKFEAGELIKTSFGMGDTRIKLGLNSLNMTNFQVDVGFEGILPTSKFTTGPRLKIYDINLDNMINDIPYLLQSIRDNLITPQLGNYGHFGLGCFFESKIDMFHNSIHLWNRVSFDNLFAATEERLIPSKQTIATPYFGGTPEQNTEFIKEYIFPPAYKITLKPGDIINFVTYLSFEIEKYWNVGFGYDFYHQQREIFQEIDTRGEDINSLRIEDAASPNAEQHKIFVQGNYIKKQKDWDLILGFGGDYTIASKNLGLDWTIFLRLGASF